jgi:hypothetical protein
MRQRFQIRLRHPKHLEVETEDQLLAISTSTKQENQLVPISKWQLTHLLVPVM